LDLNYLYFRQQVERSMAASAESEAARKAHETLADEYEHRIGMVAEAGRTGIADGNVNPTLAIALTAREVEASSETPAKAQLAALAELALAPFGDMGRSRD
jgi:hypothetical protein